MILVERTNVSRPELVYLSQTGVSCQESLMSKIASLAGAAFTNMPSLKVTVLTNHDYISDKLSMQILNFVTRSFNILSVFVVYHTT